MLWWDRNGLRVISIIFVIGYIFLGLYIFKSIDFDNKAFNSSILKVIIDSLTQNVRFAILLSLSIVCFVCAFQIIIHGAIKEKPIKLIIEFILAFTGVFIYTFISVIVLLSFKPNNVEVIIAVLGFIYGLYKIVPVMREKISNWIHF